MIHLFTVPLIVCYCVQEMARLAKLDYMEETKKDRELHEKIMAERAEARYKKHYHMAEEIMLDIVDYTTKVSEQSIN